MWQSTADYFVIEKTDSSYKNSTRIEQMKQIRTVRGTRWEEIL